MSYRSCSALQVPCGGLCEVCNDEICILGMIFVPQGDSGLIQDHLRPARYGNWECSVIFHHPS